MLYRSIHVQSSCQGIVWRLHALLVCAGAVSLLLKIALSPCMLRWTTKVILQVWPFKSMHVDCIHAGTYVCWGNCMPGRTLGLRKPTEAFLQPSPSRCNMQNHPDEDCHDARMTLCMYSGPWVHLGSSQAQQAQPPILDANTQLSIAQHKLPLPD